MSLALGTQAPDFCEAIASKYYRVHRVAQPVASQFPPGILMHPAKRRVLDIGNHVNLDKRRARDAGGRDSRTNWRHIAPVVDLVSAIHGIIVL